MKMRNTKIVCTLGPAVDDKDSLIAMLRAGMNVARLNFSHGTHDEHADRIRMLKEASADCDIPVGVLLDTKGPEIRTGKIAGGGTIDLIQGNRIVMTSEEIEGNAERLSVSYKQLPKDVQSGDHIYVADGLVDLEVVETDGRDITCVIRNGGTIGSRKNVNVPGIRTALPGMTEKDRADIIFGIGQEIDYIAASFVRRPDNISEIKELLQEHDAEIPIVAKIEDREGLDNIDEIITVADGVMVARGDLGVQLATEEIPLAQKRIIKKCNKQNKPVITATQMLDSMIQNPKPTRAELTDVANAIFDGTDAVMLSGETAGGSFPVESVRMMDRIARAVEASTEYHQRCKEYFFFHDTSENIGNAVAKAAYVVASDVDASAIVTPTLRGNSPAILNKFRPLQNIIAPTPSEAVQRQLLLHWGIYPIIVSVVEDSDVMIQNALRSALRHGYIQRLDRVVTVAGIPVNSPAMMNTIKVHVMGTILNRGHDGTGGTCTGRIVKVSTPKEAEKEIVGDGSDILLVEAITDELEPYLRDVAGVISEASVRRPLEELLSYNEDLVIIAEAPDAYAQLEEGLIVSLDGEEKIVYEGVIEG
jgi:pyruvate kinase